MKYWMQICTASVLDENLFLNFFKFLQNLTATVKMETIYWEDLLAIVRFWLESPDTGATNLCLC